jgi:hypothetical protein
MWLENEMGLFMNSIFTAFGLVGMLWFNMIFHERFIENYTSKSSSSNSNIILSSIPKGWYVSEAGQNPLNLLWFVVLLNFDDIANQVETPRYIVVEDFDSYEEALSECIKNCI